MSSPNVTVLGMMKTAPVQRDARADRTFGMRRRAASFMRITATTPQSSTTLTIDTRSVARPAERFFEGLAEESVTAG